MNIFPLHATDFYKTGHYAQYPAGTEYVYSNWTCRSDKFFRSSEVFDTFDHKVVFFGLQYVCKYLLQELWTNNFFNKSSEEVCARYKRRMDLALGPNMVTLEHIRELHDLGYLPIRIKALPEGSRVDIRVPCFTITNTVAGFGWLTNYLETAISAAPERERGQAPIRSAGARKRGQRRFAFLLLGGHVHAQERGAQAGGVTQQRIDRRVAGDGVEGADRALRVLARLSAGRGHLRERPVAARALRRDLVETGFGLLGLAGFERGQRLLELVAGRLRRPFALILPIAKTCRGEHDQHGGGQDLVLVFLPEFRRLVAPDFLVNFLKDVAHCARGLSQRLSESEPQRALGAELALPPRPRIKARPEVLCGDLAQASWSGRSFA